MYWAYFMIDADKEACPETRNPINSCYVKQKTFTYCKDLQDLIVLDDAKVPAMITTFCANPRLTIVIVAKQKKSAKKPSRMSPKCFSKKGMHHSL